MSNYIPTSLYNQILKRIPIVCVDIAITYKNEILLIKRKDPPCKDQWWIIGGRMFMFETFKEASKRIIRTETGIKISNRNKSLKNIGIASTGFPDSPAGCPMHSVNIILSVKVPNKKIKLDSHSSEYKWIALKDYKKENLNPYINRCFGLI